MILYARIYQWAEANKKTPEWQGGFCEKRSSLDNIFILNAAIHFQLRKTKGKLLALFIDLKNTFPPVNYDLLWKKLERQGLSQKIIRIMRELYVKAEMAVVSDEGTSSFADVTLGLLQGEVLSLLLFSLFIADVRDFLTRREVRGGSPRSR